MLVQATQNALQKVQFMNMKSPQKEVLDFIGEKKQQILQNSLVVQNPENLSKF